MSIERITSYLDLINKTWFFNLERRDHYYYRLNNIEQAYYRVYNEMCRLLNVNIIVQEYQPLLKQMPLKNVLRHYHFYINNLWQVIRKCKHIQLMSLEIPMSDLVIQYFKLIILLHRLNSWH